MQQSNLLLPDCVLWAVARYRAGPWPAVMHIFAERYNQIRPRMSYQVLARKYRPQRFADVIGQDHVTVTLMNAAGAGPHRARRIFSGHRGIGKTTIARILAMALNCRNAIGSEKRPTPEPCEVCESCTEIRAGNSVDVIEIDAATNRGIDEIRELRGCRPLSPRARPLQDLHPRRGAPDHRRRLQRAVEDAGRAARPHRLHDGDHAARGHSARRTVRSRVQHFSFYAVKLADILGQLRSIANAEGVLADETALSLLAEAGDGSMRDALSIMDQAIASAPTEPSADGNGAHARLEAGQIRELMGTVPNAVFERVFEAVDANRSAEVMTVANQLLDAGNSPAQLARQCVRYLRNTLVAKIAGLTPESAGEGLGNELLQISPDEQRRASRTAALFSEEELTRFLQTMLRTFDELGLSPGASASTSSSACQLVHLRRLLPIEEALELGAAPPSGAGRAPGSGANSRASTSTARRSRPAQSAAPAQTSQPARPAFSPFEQDSSRKDFARRGPEASAPMQVASVPTQPITEVRGANVVSMAAAARPMLETTPVPVPAPPATAAPSSDRDPAGG